MLEDGLKERRENNMEVGRLLLSRGGGQGYLTRPDRSASGDSGGGGMELSEVAFLRTLPYATRRPCMPERTALLASAFVIVRPML